MGPLELGKHCRVQGKPAVSVLEKTYKGIIAYAKGNTSEDPGSFGGNYQENHVGDEAPLGDVNC